MTTSDNVTDAEVRWMVWNDASDRSDLGQWLADLLRRPPWHARAACRGMDPSTFIIGRGCNAAVMTRARDVCDRCLVRPECLDYALADPDAVGIWSGTTGAERRLMRRDVTGGQT